MFFEHFSLIYRTKPWTIARLSQVSGQQCRTIGPLVEDSATKELVESSEY